MVEMITRYRTEDGLDFSTREEAEKHAASYLFSLHAYCVS